MRADAWLFPFCSSCSSLLFDSLQDPVKNKNGALLVAIVKMGFYLQSQTKFFSF